MAAAAQPPPGLFTFFKHGALLPARNRGLFLSILALTAALQLVSPRLELLRVQWRIRPGGTRRLQRFEAAAALVDCNANVHAELGPPPLTAYAFFVAVTFVNGVIKIITVSAAVASYTGGRHTLVSILGKVQSNLWSPLDTLIIFGFVLKCAAQAAQHIFLAYIFLFTQQPAGPALDALIVLGKVRSNLWGPLVTLAFGFVLQFAAQLPLLLLPYSFSFIQQPALYALIVLASLPVKAICDVAVVVSVAEPGLHGPHAAARAWRLMEGKKAQAALYVAAVWTLSLLYKLAGWWWLQSVARELPAVDVAFVLLRWADEVFFVAVVTAYYFECRRVQKEIGADLE